jgi:hypothetical protein
MNSKELRGLFEAYAKVYVNISESHFEVGDKVICKDSGMKGKVIKLDKPDGAEDEKYYTVKREDGKKIKYAPNELKSAEKEKVEEAIDPKGAARQDAAKDKKKIDVFAYDRKIGKKNIPPAPKNEEVDFFDAVLEFLQVEGIAETLEKAEEIMANDLDTDDIQQIVEVSYSAKEARAGKDIGKPGKQFGQIAKEAGKRYGSMERGKKVAGAILAKLRAKKG